MFFIEKESGLRLAVSKLAHRRSIIRLGAGKIKGDLGDNEAGGCKLP